jgi:hypothetical protein
MRSLMSGLDELSGSCNCEHCSKELNRMQKEAFRGRGSDIVLGPNTYQKISTFWHAILALVQFWLTGDLWVPAGIVWA